MTPDEIIKKMTKGVSKIDVDLNEMMKQSVIHCTENGTHLMSCDDDGFCNECGYQESIDDFDE